MHRNEPCAGALLIGGPGQGKSTLGQLACQGNRAALLRASSEALSPAARQVIESFDAEDAAEIRWPQAPLLPLRIVVPEAAGWLVKHAGAATPDAEPLPALLRFLADQPSGRKTRLDAAALFALLGALPFLLVLDGFDELGAPDDRERVVAAARKLLVELGERGARATVLATTRPQRHARELSRLGAPLRTLYLAPLEKHEALRYAEKLTRAKISGADDQETALSRLRSAAVDPGTSRLMQTPLQVTILSALVQQMGHVPSERWKLFWSYFDFTYRREIARGTFASKLLEKHRAHIEAIHRRVALLLQIEAEGEGGAAARMPRPRIQEIVDSVLREDDFGEEERADLAARIVDAAEQRLVFLVEPEIGNFGFEIRSLQEFMAAWALTGDGLVDASLLEARWLQIAKVPLFRGVVLFMASKLFSERSPLRDVLAERVCGALDEDPADAPARAIRAGALLALEALEEGSALSQPRRARALLSRAASLLELPPGPEHARLARVASSGELAETLQAALAAQAQAGAGDEPSLTLAAWVCIVEGTHAGAAWAPMLGDAWWPQLKSPSRLLEACRMARVRVSPWLIAKIEASAGDFPPESFRDLLGLEWSEAEYQVRAWRRGWVGAVLWMYVRSGAARRYSKNEACVLLRSETDREGDAREWLRPLSTMPAPPPAWRAWVAAAAFEQEPSASALARALRVIATTAAREDWPGLARVATWPLAACLNSAADAADLEQFAGALEQGLLGDAPLWEDAERRWALVNPTSAWFDEDIGRLPWNPDRLDEAPPLSAVDMVFVVSLDAPHHAALLSRAASAFRKLADSPLRARVAEVCLWLASRRSSRSMQVRGEASAWTQALREDAVFPLMTLLHGSIHEHEDDWLELVAESGRRRPRSLPPELPRALDLYLRDPTRPGLLYWASFAICSLDATRSPALTRARLAKAVTSHSYEGAAARCDAAILRSGLGVVTLDDVRGLIHDVANQAKHEASSWHRFVRALRRAELPEALREAMLLQVYEAQRGDPLAAGETILALREALESRRSGLADQATWDRLKLPLPYPASTASAPLRAAIPEEPIALRRIHVQHLRGLGDLKLDLALPPTGMGQWIVVLGPNGAGKTTLLRSLVLSLRSLADPKIWPKGTFVTPWCANSGPGEARITVELHDGRHHRTSIRRNGSETFTQDPALEQSRLFPLFAYGCRRGSALGGVAREVNLKEDDGPEVATLFDEGAPLVHAETWLSLWEADALKNLESKAIFEAVRSALTALLEVDAIEIRGREVWVSGPKVGGSVLFRALSDGYLTTAGWFLDLIARWIELAVRYKVPLDGRFLERMTGLVLLDEIDLHLHPRWQVEVIQRVRELLPKMSFVVTTHNPLTLVGARAEEIWILSSEDGRVRAARGIETPMLLTGGQIYSQYFGIADLYPHELGKKLRRYGFLSGYALRDDAEQAEMEVLREELRKAGIDPGWEEVPRERLPDTEAAPPKRAPARRRRKGA